MNPASIVEIDSTALKHNFQLVQKRIPERTAVLACVKANAYGHGMLACAETFCDAGADVLGVARASEAIALREHGITARILLMAAEGFGALDGLVRHNIEVAVDSEERIAAVSAAAHRTQHRVSVHLAVNVGMNRFEARPDEAARFAQMILADDALNWAGIMTHFPVADADTETTRDQLSDYLRTVNGFADGNLPVPTRHVANSAAILTLPESHLDMVRPGLMLYGMQPTSRPVDGLVPALSWKTRVAALHSIQKGESVGYGSSFTAARETVIATLPVGYGDGLPWCTANRGWVLIHGRRLPVIGRISMDQTTVDVTSIAGVKLGDSAVLIGTQGGETLFAEDWAAWAGTINYEITTRIMPRMQRQMTGTDL